MQRATYTALPPFARAAIDRLQMNHALRTLEQLNALLDAYAKGSGVVCSTRLRARAYAVAASRFLMPALAVAAA